MKIKILKSAGEDFKEIRANAKQYKTATGYADFKQAFRELYADMKLFPYGGVVPPEATGFGIQVRMRICEQIRVVYEVRDDIIYIRMYLSTYQDFQSHLIAKILRDTI